MTKNQPGCSEFSKQIWGSEEIGALMERRSAIMDRVMEQTRLMTDENRDAFQAEYDVIWAEYVSLTERYEAICGLTPERLEKMRAEEAEETAKYTKWALEKSEVLRKSAIPAV